MSRINLDVTGDLHPKITELKKAGFYTEKVK